MLLNILILLLILNLLIFVHELGHLLTALWVGVKVYEFSLGFGPVLFSRDIRGVRVSLRLIPLGGYVDLEDEPEEEGSLLEISLLKQYAVILGGVLANLVFGVFMLAGFIYFSGGKVLVGVDFKPWFAKVNVVEQNVFVLDIDKDSDLYGKIEPGKTVIKEVDGVKIDSADTLLRTLDQARRNAADNIVSVKVYRVDTSTEMVLRVKLNEKGRLGITVTDVAMYEWDYAESKAKFLASPVLYAVDTVVVTGKYLGAVISYAVSSKDAAVLGEAVGSPVSLYPAVSEVVKSDSPVLLLLQLIGLLSINLALLNILPIPPLDGWQLLFVPVKSKTRDSKLAKVFKGVTLVGVALLIILSVLLVFKDIKLLLS